MKKNNRQIIKFYPFSEKTIGFAPEPMPASKKLPSWYRAQPAEINEKTDMMMGTFAATVKKCMPVFDAMTAGYVLVAPCDIYIDSTNPEKLQFSIPTSMKQFQADMFASHAREQYAEYPLDTSIYHKDLFRVLPFWSVQTSKGYSCLFMQPAHSDNSSLTAIGGIVDTDGFISEGHFSFMVRKDFKGVIKQGTPLVQILPFKREPWEMEIVDLETSMKVIAKQRLGLRSTFLNGYKNKFRSPKEYR